MKDVFIHAIAGACIGHSDPRHGAHSDAYDTAELEFIADLAPESANLR